MTREEEIKVSALKYLDHFTPDICGICDEDVFYAYMSGAKWADKHPNTKDIWHNASEEPTEYPIICQDENEYFWIQYNHYDWECYTEETELSQWAYINDLLPKGSEK